MTNNNYLDQLFPDRETAMLGLSQAELSGSNLIEPRIALKYLDVQAQYRRSSYRSNVLSVELPRKSGKTSFLKQLYRDLPGNTLVIVRSHHCIPEWIAHSINIYKTQAVMTYIEAADAIRGRQIDNLLMDDIGPEAMNTHLADIIPLCFRDARDEVKCLHLYSFY